jgi:CoA:oxalate CoA-transferase
VTTVSHQDQPLTGLRVLDFTTVMAGPYCARVLSSLGADVVKLESPEGDYTRGAEPLRGAGGQDRARSAYFAELNNGKSGIVLDLREEAQRLKAVALALRADIVVQNFRPGVLARFGLDYATLSRARPELVYCSISGYGQDGPSADRPATAQAVHAMVGYDLAFAAYQPGDAAPPATGLFVADGMAGALAVAGVLGALRLRDTTGVGRHVDVALDRSLLSMLVYEVQTAQFDPGFVRKGYRPARTRDGHIMIAAVNHRNFVALCQVIGRSDLLDDPRFATTGPRWRAYDQLHAVIEEWTAARSSHECERILLEAGVPAACYQRVGEYLTDPTVRETVLTDAVDAAGPLKVTGPPFRLSPPSGYDTGPERPERPRHVPDLGEHTDAVLARWLGETAAAMTATRDDVDLGGR